MAKSKNTVGYLTKEKYFRELYFVKETDCNRFIYKDGSKGILTSQAIFDGTIAFRYLEDAEKWIKKHTYKGSSIHYKIIKLKQDRRNKNKWDLIPTL